MSGTESIRRPAGRLVWLDALRGFTVASMVLYHGMWDAVYLFGLKAPWYYGLPGYLWQQSICWTFIFLAGFSFRFDRKPLKRGLMIFGAGALVTLVTTLFMPEDRILFGVLTLIGSCILLTVPVDRLCRRHSEGPAGREGARGGFACAGLGISAALFFLTRNVNRGWLGFEGIRLVPLPAGLYRGMFMTYLGFPEPSFFSTDYFSLIPWFFLFLCGYFFHGTETGRRLRRADAPAKERTETGKGQKKIPALLRGLCFLGRHAMAVYIVHQPAILAVLEAVSWTAHRIRR